MQLKSLLERVEYTSSGNMDISIEDIVYDSRRCRPGVVFVCLEGASVDGHMYAAAAAQAGAAAVVAARPVETGDVPLILVKDTRAALAQMSAAFFHYPAEEIPVVGITGTKGKTTSAYMICSILEAAGIKTGMIGTVGIRIGETVTATDNTTPESYIVQRALRDMVDAGCGAAVMEASSIGLRGHRAEMQSPLRWDCLPIFQRIISAGPNTRIWKNILTAKGCCSKNAGLVLLIGMILCGWKSRREKPVRFPILGFQRSGSARFQGSPYIPPRLSGGSFPCGRNDGI